MTMPRFALPLLAALGGVVVIGATSSGIEAQASDGSDCTASCWIVTVADTAARGVTAFDGQIVVPPAPTEYNGEMVLFLNHGLQGGKTDGSYNLMQAVLQWGDSGEIGGDRWLIACWLEQGLAVRRGKPPGLVVSNHIPVEPGDTVELSIYRTEMEVTSEQGTFTSVSWTCSANSDAGRAVMSSVGEFNPALDRAVVGLEAMGLDRVCSNFPSDPVAVFTGLTLDLGSGTPVTPDWEAPRVVDQPDCGFGANVSGSEVKIIRAGGAP